jgi:Arc/MetJ-type ribon-helix-helix transcriptional regulator
MHIKKKTLSGKVPSSYFEEVLTAMRNRPGTYPTKSEFIRKATRRELDSMRYIERIPSPGVRAPARQPAFPPTPDRAVYLDSRGPAVREEPSEEESCARPTKGEISISDAGKTVSPRRLVSGRRLPPLRNMFTSGR